MPSVMSSSWNLNTDITKDSCQKLRNMYIEQKYKAHTIKFHRRKSILLWNKNFLGYFRISVGVLFNDNASFSKHLELTVDE
jgi:hypothetical protein